MSGSALSNLYGSGWESNPPNVGIRRPAGFEDRDGHQIRLHSPLVAALYRQGERLPMRRPIPLVLEISSPNGCLTEESRQLTNGVAVQRCGNPRRVW